MTPENLSYDTLKDTLRQRDDDACLKVISDFVSGVSSSEPFRRVFSKTVASTRNNLPSWTPLSESEFDSRCSMYQTSLQTFIEQYPDYQDRLTCKKVWFNHGTSFKHECVLQLAID